MITVINPRMIPYGLEKDGNGRWNIAMSRQSENKSIDKFHTNIHPGFHSANFFYWTESHYSCWPWQAQEGLRQHFDIHSPVARLSCVNAISGPKGINLTFGHRGCLQFSGVPAHNEPNHLTNSVMCPSGNCVWRLLRTNTVDAVCRGLCCSRLCRW